MKKTLVACLSAMIAVPTFVLPAVFTAAVATSGCTAIGFGIGAAIDNSHKTPNTMEAWQIRRIEKGTWVKVSLRDGSEVEGSFNGLSFDGNEYAQRYEERQKQTEGVVLPSLGETITVSSPKGKTTVGRFDGFEFASIGFRPEGNSPPLDVPFEKVSAVSFAGREPLSGAQLQALRGQGALPLRSRMAVRDARIPVERVSQIAVPHHGHAKTIGALIGLGVDVAIIAVLGSSKFCFVGCK
ncbi:MAG TPA: hypothetical protein VN461_20130 [Vicinamibacteria bacterium]|nr:hypothetical protein [Vicinamibacteria bacterium]